MTSYLVESMMFQLKKESCMQHVKLGTFLVSHFAIPWLSTKLVQFFPLPTGPNANSLRHSIHIFQIVTFPIHIFRQTCCFTSIRSGWTDVNLWKQIFAVLQPGDLVGRSNGLCRLCLRVAISVFLSQQIYYFANIKHSQCLKDTVNLCRPNSAATIALVPDFLLLWIWQIFVKTSQTHLSQLVMMYIWFWLWFSNSFWWSLLQELVTMILVGKKTVLCKKLSLTHPGTQIS